MDSHNALGQLLRSPYAVPDPGNGNIIEFNRNFLYASLSAASATSGAETRTLSAPLQAGLTCSLGCRYYGNGAITVSCLDNLGNTTGTIAFGAIAQWASLVSVEVAAGQFAWACTDAYGCTITSLTQSVNAFSATNAAALIATNLTVSTGASIAAILGTSASIGSVTATAAAIAGLNATSVTAGTCNVSSNFSVVNATVSGINATSATAVSVSASQIQAMSTISAPSFIGTAATIVAEICTSILVGTGGFTQSNGPQVFGSSAVYVTGGTAANTANATLLSSPVNLLSVGTSNKNYFCLPAASAGLCVNVVNLGSTVGLWAAGSNSIASATSVSLATANAAGSALELVCDGTNWWKRVL